jgi:hypothetical protein
MPAIIGKPAPKWKAAAVVNGEIKDISLDDYKGRINSIIDMGLWVLQSQPLTC